MDDTEKKGPGRPQKKDKPTLLGDCLRAYGIDRRFIHSHRVDDEGLVTVLTKGGAMVRYQNGEMLSGPISDTQISGISPKKPKPITGARREK